MSLYSKCSVFSGHFLWAPKKAGFVQPLQILWPYRSCPAMGTNGDKCCLLLIENPTLEAQPRHEVAIGVPAPPPPPFKAPKCFRAVGFKDCTWAPPPMVRLVRVCLLQK